MRRILIERARRRITAKRGGGVAMVDVEGIEIPSPVADNDHLLAVNEALERFATLDPAQGRTGEAALLRRNEFRRNGVRAWHRGATAKQWWAYARAWLTVELRNGAPG